MSVDGRPVDSGRGRRGRRRRRVQRVDEPDSADPRLGIRPPLDVRSAAAAAARTGDPSTAAEQTAAGRPAAGEGGQLVGEGCRVAAEVVRSPGVEKGADR